MTFQPGQSGHVRGKYKARIPDVDTLSRLIWKQNKRDQYDLSANPFIASVTQETDATGQSDSQSET